MTFSHLFHGKHHQSPAERCFEKLFLICHFCLPVKPLSPRLGEPGIWENGSMHSSYQPYGNIFSSPYAWLSPYNSVTKYFLQQLLKVFSKYCEEHMHLFHNPWFDNLPSEAGCLTSSPFLLHIQETLSNLARQVTHIVKIQRGNNKITNYLTVF